jgi:hypothetical protein
MIIKIPNIVKSDFEGFQFLTRICYDLQKVKNELIVFDFEGVLWFDANLCAVLGACFNKSYEKLNQVKLINMNNSLENIFCRNHFLASFGGAIIPDFNEMAIKYRKNKLTDEKLIHSYLLIELMGRSDFPKLSNAARKETERSIFEIFSNAVLHGNCDSIFSCGQYYPQNQPPLIDFTIVDLGNTIKQNVNQFLNSSLTGTEAIEWAITEKHTTKLKGNNIPGGLGFKIICDFVELNKGKVQIVSSDGYWQLEKGITNSMNLGTEFPGTIVNLEFNLDDKNFYYLQNETTDDIIF